MVLARLLSSLPRLIFAGQVVLALILSAAPDCGLRLLAIPYGVPSPVAIGSPPLNSLMPVASRSSW